MLDPVDSGSRKLSSSQLHATNACFRYCYEHAEEIQAGGKAAFVPMQTYIDYLGFRVVVTVHMSSTSLENNNLDENEFNQVLKPLAETLGLSTPLSVQVTRDEHSRLYLNQLNSLFPSEFTNQDIANDEKGVAVGRLRPELLNHFKTIQFEFGSKLTSEGLVETASEASIRAGNYLVKTRVKELAEYLTELDDRAFNMERAFLQFSTACNELPFLQRVLIQAKQDWLPRQGALLNAEEFWWDINCRVWEALKELGATENVCYVPMPKWAAGLWTHAESAAFRRMTLAQLFHSFGVPMHMCGVVGPLLTREHLQLKLLVEATSRAMKHLLQHELRTASNNGGVKNKKMMRTTISAFFSIAIGPRTRTVTEEDCFNDPNNPTELVSPRRSVPRIPIDSWTTFWRESVPNEVKKSYGDEALRLGPLKKSGVMLFDVVRPFLQQVLQYTQRACGIKINPECTQRVWCSDLAVYIYI